MQKTKLFNFLFSFMMLSFFLLSCNGKLPPTQAKDGVDVKVNVLDKKSQQPVSQAIVSLKKDDAVVGTAQQTDTTGIVTFKNITPADGYIAFVDNATGFKSAASSEIKVVAGADATTVLLDRISNGDGSGLIAGSVKDRASKQSISNLMITYSGPKINKSVLTDENGSFVIEGLVTGNYVLTFAKSGYARIQKIVPVKDGQSSSVETIFLTKQLIKSLSINYSIKRL
ncbi:MAG: carboxypeptidase regulatory-like domain-containing protein [Candidatus Sericytochromatia bacterium]|nr:carboxypeptidase regulatory-like domain-containing protein [Candidatus Sericytochromatia bacterium]